MSTFKRYQFSLEIRPEGSERITFALLIITLRIAARKMNFKRFLKHILKPGKKRLSEDTQRETTADEMIQLQTSLE